MTAASTGGESTAGRLDKELADIEARVQALGAWSLSMLRDGMAAFARGDTSLAADVVGRDDHLNASDVEIEQEAMRLLVTQQPAGRDLRALGAVLKIVTYLDRIGRYGYDLARLATGTATEQRGSPWPLLQIMSDQAASMVQTALRAFETRDLGMARAVYEADDAVDELNRQVLTECVAGTKAGADGSGLLKEVLVSRDLERVADNACKIAEKTIYMVTGRRRTQFLGKDGKVSL